MTLSRKEKAYLTKAQARDFQLRWAALKEAEDEELASTSMAEKFRQLTGLLASARRFGWTEDLAVEEDKVRQRWIKLRQVLHV
jgi:hypothetical protein